MSHLKSEEHLPHISYDSVVFGFSGDKLKILVLQYRNTDFFALPGGFVKTDENLNDAVKRGVKERTGLEDIFLEQFYTFGKTSRKDSETMKTILRANELDFDKNDWLLERFISVAYYALINYEKVKLQTDEISESIDWYAIDELPPLIFGHDEIVQKALETLREDLEKKLVGINLLPTKFTMKELQQVHEAILDEKLRRTTFQRKILGMEILQRHEKQFSGKAHKAPYLYSFNLKKN